MPVLPVPFDYVDLHRVVPVLDIHYRFRRRLPPKLFAL